MVLAATGMGWVTYRGALEGITTSDALEGESTSTGDTENILIMGIDSRLDQHGNPLPQDIYDAMHAGDETTGDYTADVLIVVHLPGDGSPATAFSIPRDDYVDLAGCPGDICEGKVKEAYGYAYEAAKDSSEAESEDAAATDLAATEQQAREAGRKAQIATVRELLEIPIDHFVEITLGAFFEIAKAVAPITVCLNEATSDPYSGADFQKGEQQIDAAQAMAFVRQRRDINDAGFTDLDRTRRQQAFIAALVTRLGESGALNNTDTLRNLLNVVKHNVALDAGFDIASFARRATALTENPPTLYTLPIVEFTTNEYGEDINIIDVPTIRKIVDDLVTDDDAATTTTSTAVAKPLDGQGATLDVINGSNYTGLASQLRTTFGAQGFTEGEVGDAEALAATTTIEYGPGADAAAQALADELGVTATLSEEVLADTVQLTVGTDFPGDEYLNESVETTTETTTTESTTTTPVTTVAATASGTYTPAPTDLSQMTASGVPCVK
ncbi:LCP family protein [Mycolicibacterium sp. XJ870]